MTDKIFLAGIMVLNEFAGKRDPLDFVFGWLALRSGYFFPTKVNY